jgi:hypothetical protein
MEIEIVYQVVERSKDGREKESFLVPSFMFLVQAGFETRNMKLGTRNDSASRHSGEENSGLDKNKECFSTATSDEVVDSS